MVDWDSVDEIFLDMDGTLFDLHFDNFFWMEHLPQRYAEINNCSAEEVRSDLHDRYNRMRGTLDWYCLDFWQAELDVDIVGLKKEIAHKIQFRPNALQFLQSIQGTKKRVSLVSNAHRSSIDLKFTQLDTHDYFDRICSSHDYQSPKENQLFWQSLHKDLQFNAGRTLFIDDSLAVLDSARAYGIGQILSIAQPDLSKPEQVTQGYTQVRDFDQLLVGLAHAEERTMDDGSE